MTNDASRPALWVRLLARLPWSALYGLAAWLAFMADRVVPHRPAMIREHLRRAFPDLDAASIESLKREHYRNYAQVLVEIIKSAAIDGEELDARMRFVHLERMRQPLQAGTPVVLLAAHQCNWEWILLGLSRQLGFPIEAAYKPLKNAWADREMRALRSRFGARMIPAERVMRELIANRRAPRLIALVADQEPVASDRRHWTRFLNRDTAFFMGADVIVNTLRYPAFFVAIHRVRRGVYEASFEPLWTPDEPLQPGEFTERYARRVERQIRESPADWPWSYKRWRLRREDG